MDDAAKEEANRRLIAEALKRYQALQQETTTSSSETAVCAAAAAAAAAASSAGGSTSSTPGSGTSHTRTDSTKEELQTQESAAAAALALPPPDLSTAAAAAAAAAVPTGENNKNNNNNIDRAVIIASSLSSPSQPAKTSTTTTTTAACSQPPVLLKQLLSQMNLIIAAMPTADTSEYYTALLCVPHLIQQESNPILFLQCLDWNPQAAATRLVFYWKTRCRLFHDRAFCPMILSSASSAAATTRTRTKTKGSDNENNSTSNSNNNNNNDNDDDDGAAAAAALTARDRESIRAGHMVILPNDQAGRTVLWAENSRRLVVKEGDQQQDDDDDDGDDGGDIVKRCMFYFAQVISENPLSQSDGFVGISVLNNDEKQKYDSHMTQSVSSITKSFPIKFKAWHIIDLSPKGAFAEWENRFTEFSKILPCTIHRYKRKRDFVSALGAFGLTRQGLPRIVGGLWRYEQFVLWQKERTRMERRRFPASALPVNDWDKNTLTNTTDADQNHEEDGENESTDFLTDYRRILEEAMNQVPVPQKQAYLEALQMAPSEIWENESNRDWFLSVEELNCWLAAKRLARYWQVRAEVFRERRHLPLHQTGDGALNRADLSVLGTAFLKILPNDTFGCSVIWMNPPKLEGVFNNEAYVKRCMFYMFSLLAENKESQRNGATLLYMCDGGKDDDLKSGPSCLLSYLERLVNALPINFKSAHVLRLSNEPIPDDFTSKFHFCDEVFTHCSMNKTELVAKLQSHGIEPLKQLPKRLGGEWTRAKYFEWQELRTRCEWHLPLGLSGRSVIVQGSDEFPALRPYTLLPDDEKAERKRRLDVIHSRRKRDRIRIETEVLRESVEELEDEQAALKAETARLESLLEAAVGVTTQQIA